MPAPPPIAFSVVAGSTRGAGTADGALDVAEFQSPQSLVQDAAGNIFVADTLNHTIRRISPAGVVTTIAGVPGQFGTADGDVTSARFTLPGGVALGEQGDLYVADTGNHTIRRISAQGQVTTIAGRAGQPGAANGPAALARFTNPRAVARDGTGALLVGDDSGELRRVQPDGSVERFAGSFGSDASVAFGDPPVRMGLVMQVAVDRAGNVFTAEREPNTGIIGNAGGYVRRFDLRGNPSPWGSQVNGAVRLVGPGGVALAPSGDVYVSTAGIYRLGATIGVAYGTIRRIATNGNVSVVAGQDDFIGRGFADGVGSAARFLETTGLAWSNDGRLLVADTGNHAIRIVDPSGNVTTLAGGDGKGNVDGQGAHARFFNPIAIGAMPDGSLRVGDRDNATIRRVTPNGEVTTVSVVIQGRTVTRVGAWYLDALATSSVGETYYSSTSGNLLASGIEALDRQDNELYSLGASTFIMASSPAALYYAGGLIRVTKDGVRRDLGAPTPPPTTALAADDDDNVAIASRDIVWIRSSAGTLRVLAGRFEGPGTVDAVGPAARFDGLVALAFDRAGTLYAADAKTIRRIDRDGRVTTIASWVPGGAGLALPAWTAGTRALAWSQGFLYGTARHAVFRIGPMD